jgi:Zn-finger nucleic acid-binding protein
MKCPVCLEVNLAMTERQGIEIDYCPQCRGIWLDRGELDKIIERSATASKTPQQGQEGQRRPSESRPHHNDGRDDYRGEYRTEYRDDYHGDYRKKKKRESFLDDLFDF